MTNFHFKPKEIDIRRPPMQIDEGQSKVLDKCSDFITLLDSKMKRAIDNTIQTY